MVWAGGNRRKALQQRAPGQRIGEPSPGGPVIGKQRAPCLHRHSSATELETACPQAAFSASMTRLLVQIRFIRVIGVVSVGFIAIEIFDSGAGVENDHAFAGTNFTCRTEMVESCEAGDRKST